MTQFPKLTFELHMSHHFITYEFLATKLGEYSSMANSTYIHVNMSIFEPGISIPHDGLKNGLGFYREVLVLSNAFWRRGLAF